MKHLFPGHNTRLAAT